MAVRKPVQINDVLGFYADFDKWLAGNVSNYPKNINDSGAEKLSQFFALRDALRGEEDILYDGVGAVIAEDFKNSLEDGIQAAKPAGVTNWKTPQLGRAETRAHRQLANVATFTDAIIDPIETVYKKNMTQPWNGKPSMTDKIRSVLNKDLRGQGGKVVGSEASKKAYYKRISDDVNKKNHELIGSDLARSLTYQRSLNTLAYRAAQQEAWIINNDQIAGWWWKSRKDASTCLLCLSMHGTKHSVADEINSHRNCRCEMVPIVGHSLLSGGDLGVTGEQWIQIQDKETQIKVLGPTRYKLWKDKEFTLAELIGPYNDPLFGPSLQILPLNLLLTKRSSDVEKELMADITDKFPKLKGKIDLYGIGAELKVPILQILQEFGNKYPEAVGQMIGFVTVGSGKAIQPLNFGATAHVSSHNAPLDPIDKWKKLEFQAVFRDERYVSLKKARDEEDIEFNAGWLSSDHPLAVFHHELAHVVWNNLTNNYAEVLTDESGQTINQYYHEWLVKYYKEIDHISNYAKGSAIEARELNKIWPPNRRLVLSHHEPEAENYANVATAKVKHDSAKMHVYFLDEMMKLIRDGTFRQRTDIPLSPTGRKARVLRKTIAEKLDWNLRGGVKAPAVPTPPISAAQAQQLVPTPLKSEQYTKFKTLAGAKQWANDNKAPILPSTSTEAGDFIHQTFIERGDTKARSGSEIAENFKKIFEGRITKVSATKKTELQNAINHNYTSNTWKEIVGLWGPEQVVLAKPEPGVTNKSMERRGPTTIVYDNGPYMLKYQPTEVSIPGESTSGALGGLSAELRHEYGHMIWNSLDQDEVNRISSRFGTDIKSIREGITYYAGESKVETFSELFAIITSKNYDPGNFPAWVGLAGDEIMKAVLDKTKTRKWAD